MALGATRFGRKELEASREMLVVARIGVGYDAVDVPALTAKKIPLMVAGTANSPSVAEQAMFMMLTLAKRGAELMRMVTDNQWNKRMRPCRSTSTARPCWSSASAASARAAPSAARPWR